MVATASLQELFGQHLAAQSMIDCKHVTKRYKNLVAVDDVSFQVQGGICALVGPNGAGKSTLLKVLTGLLYPSAGDVQIAGFDMASQPLQAKHNIGVVPEDLGLFDSLTVREHLELTGPIYGIGKHETRERADALLRVLGLSNAGNVFIDQCSHGMRKKTALAMAMLPNPKVLFLDEPFEGIDPVSSKSIRELLVTISKRGITVFFTSHILSMVDRLATEVLLIRSGRIVWCSDGQKATHPLEELYFKFVETFPLEDLSWLRS